MNQSTWQFVTALIVVWQISFGIAAAVEDNSLYHQLTTVGIAVSGVKSVPLPVPTLRDEMSAETQHAALAGIIDKIGEERFYKNSAVSPFVLNIDAAEKLADGTQVQRVDLWFAAYGELAAIEDKQLLKNLSDTEKKSNNGLPEEMRQLTETEVQQGGLTAGTQSNGSESSYAFMQASVLERVHLAIVSQSLKTRSDESIILATVVDSKVAANVKLPCRWCPITNDELGNAKLGEPHDYSAAASYCKVTKLKQFAGALLVEVHILFVEPVGWFEGRNLLRSKLPPVIQDGVRTFRRKL